MIDFKTSSYFTGMPKILGYLLIPIGILALFSPQFVVGIVLVFAGVVIITTHYRLAINPIDKKYSEYISLLGLKTCVETHTYDQISYAFVKKAKISQVLNSRVSSTTIRKEEFQSYLKFSEDDRVHLMSSESKTEVLNKLRPIAEKLKTIIVDYSSGNPVEVK
jgi:hypothetical protein